MFFHQSQLDLERLYKVLVAFAELCKSTRAKRTGRCTKLAFDGIRIQRRKIGAGEVCDPSCLDGPEACVLNEGALLSLSFRDVAPEKNKKN